MKRKKKCKQQLHILITVILYIVIIFFSFQRNFYGFQPRINNKIIRLKITNKLQISVELNVLKNL